jgi:phosphoglycolate phosphatase
MFPDELMTARKLIIFDCDGTLVDSQNAIVAAMDFAFDNLGLTPPARAETLSVVGLSLPEAFAVLAPGESEATRAALAERYRSDFPRARAEAARHDPLFPGIGNVITTLAQRSDVVMGVATGKSKRGVKRLFDQESWHGAFRTIQTADDNPSKPHPGMILRAMAETGNAPETTVMIGDTTYDIEMARAAHVGAIGVAWGYHPSIRLMESGAHRVVTEAPELIATIEHVLAEHAA